MLEQHFPQAEYIQLVPDHLNTHFATSLMVTFGESQAKKLLQRIPFIYTPKHAGWLNMGEMEISVMDTQCTAERIESSEKRKAAQKAWAKQRNKNKNTIEWTLTRQEADIKLSKRYISYLICQCTIVFVVGRYVEFGSLNGFNKKLLFEIPILFEFRHDRLFQT